MKRKTLLLGLLLVALAMLVFAGTALASAPAPAPVCTDRVFQGGPEEQPAASPKLFFPRLASPCTSTGVVPEVPFALAWASSGHADKTSPAFTHWDTTNPPQVAVPCAKCHTTSGYQQFLATGSVTPQPIGQTVECMACHNNLANAKTSIKFNSGLIVNNLGQESNCMECHQGISSGPQVQTAIDTAALANDDTPSDKLVWTAVAPHYFTAAISMFGKEGGGGYQYPGMEYDVRFQHVQNYDTCQSCHNQHSLTFRYDECAKCHEDVDPANPSVDQLHEIRMEGSGVDYDGNGNRRDGMYFELEGLANKLYAAIQAYSAQVAGKPIVYDGAVYPYWFNDTNGNGQVDTGENTFGNQYKSFTNRSLKAAYNYQLWSKDPGAYAHGGKYIIELMYDGIMDINPKITPQIDMTNAHREDPGHFASAQMPWRDWDAAAPEAPLDGEVEQACGRCHSADGLPLIVNNTGSNGLPPVTVSGGNSYALSIKEPVTSALMCTTCHKELGGDWARNSVPKVQFPSGAVLTFAADAVDDNICMTCHQGRESTTSVNFVEAGKPDDTVDAALRFKNIHYLAAGATLWGNDAKGMYQYTGNTYRGKLSHVPTQDTCTECHSAHRLAVRWDSTTPPTCQTCHGPMTSAEDLLNIRFATDTTDWNGNGNITEGVYYEIKGMNDALYDAIKLYAKDVVGTCIVYAPDAYPYFYVDANCNGVKDPDETTGYNKWTPRLQRNTFNLNYVVKEPGNFAHNPMYTLQVLYDNLTDMSQKVNVPNLANMHRPS